MLLGGAGLAAAIVIGMLLLGFVMLLLGRR